RLLGEGGSAEILAAERGESLQSPRRGDPPGPKGLARYDGDALNPRIALPGQPKRRASHATAGVEDLIAPRDTGYVGHDPIHVVQRLFVVPGSLVPVPDMEGRISERHALHADVEPAFLVVGDSVLPDTGL